MEKRMLRKEDTGPEDRRAFYTVSRAGILQGRALFCPCPDSIPLLR